MKYFVVVCPKCEFAKIATSGTKTTTCPHCGRRIEVMRRKKYFEGYDLNNLRAVVEKINRKKFRNGFF